MSGFLVIGILSFSYFGWGKPRVLNETEENIITNKSRFLTEQSFDYFMYGGEYYFDFYLRSGNDDMVVQKTYTSDAYPFLHTAEYPDVLSPYFDSLQQAPDIVFIFLESFGKAYSGKDAYLGSFTPFLDSLEQHSLVWLNAISSTGRTFGLQPGVFGGFPFGEKGFLELYQNFPYHKSFLSILRDNEYEIRYFIGSDKNFDHVGDFIEYQNPVQLVDEKDFDSKYSKAPSASGNFTWGFADKELFRNGLEKLPQSYSKPQVITFQTQTSHDPYIVPERPFYEEKLKNHLEQTLKIPSSEIPDYMAYEDIYMTVLYADDAVKEFITKYKERPEFENTIFIITGDHRLPEIPMSDRLDRFHVPLIIYSPLLKKQEYFRGVSSHFEITPSLLSFLKNQAGIQLPEQKTWLGQVLDTARTFQSRIAMPLMRNKNQLIDYIHGDLFYSDGQLFKVSDNLSIDPINSPDDLTQLKGEFEDFKNKNNYMVQTRKLYPEPKSKID
ncbi:LTA synthase family protein [Algoriphagus sp. PAP.12]|uniref:LTA synthase family protein n=1 Tax=Algoriphagus sp. PAP.12 TaxID=2996678 RepID=UPI00227AEFD1|nr:LTA synthase family protein [Algoriphagus sp. PAP.12]